MKEFTSFGSFGRHLGRLALEGEAVSHHVTEEGAKIIQEDAQGKLGVYQEESGPFNAWAELAESTQKDRASQGFTPNDPLRRTGELAESIEVQQSGNQAVIGSESPIAGYQEMGTDRIPPRPFLGPAAFESKRPIGERAAGILVAWISGLGWRRPRQVMKLP